MSVASTLKNLQNAAGAIGSAAKHVGAANLELAKVVAPVIGAVALSVPRRFGNKLDEARNAETPEKRQHAATVFGVGACIVAGLAVATIAHVSSKRRKKRILREHKRHVAAALKREKLIDDTIAKAVALRPAGSLVQAGDEEDLAFAKNPGCYAILTYEPDVAEDDPSAYRDVYVDGADDMLASVNAQLLGNGNLYVRADMLYGLPVYVAFFPCDKEKIETNKHDLVEALGADASYNSVGSKPSYALPEGDGDE